MTYRRQPAKTYVQHSWHLTSAAFDAVHHDTLLDRARTVFGIDDVALDWIRSFVTGCTQQIVVGSEKSTVFSSKSGVPQGSVLGPILFGMYVSPVGDVIAQHPPPMNFGIRKLEYLCYRMAKKNCKKISTG